MGWSAGLGAPLLVIALATICSCGSLSNLPELVRPVFEEFTAEVREQVEEAYEQAVANPEDAAAAGRLAMILHAHDQYGGAAAAYHRAAFLQPDLFRWSYYRGVALVESGRSSEALVCYRKALEQAPGDLSTKLRLGELLVAAGEDAEGYQLYEAILREHPDTPAAYYGMGRIRSAQNRPEEALRHYGRAAALLKDFGPLHYALALCYRRLGEAAAASRHMAVYERIGPTRRPPYADPLMEEVEALKSSSYIYQLHEGRRFEAAGRLEQARAAYQRAIEADPSLPHAHVNLIGVYGALGNFKKAEQHFNEALTINPELEETHYNLGVLRTLQSRYQEAAEAFERALETNPFSAESHNNLGYALEQLQRPDEAVAHYRAALENKPNYRLAHFHLGRHLFARGRRQEAIAHLEQTISPEDEETPQFLLVLARACKGAGDREKALHYARLAKDSATRFGKAELLPLINQEIRSVDRH